jgi:hypothetical protein
VSVCVTPLAWQRFGKKVTAATNTSARI